MTEKELNDFAIDFATLLDIAEVADSAEDVSNSAIEMIKDILSKNKKLRFKFYEIGCGEHLEKLGLDNGNPW